MARIRSLQFVAGRVRHRMDPLLVEGMDQTFNKHRFWTKR